MKMIDRAILSALLVCMLLPACRKQKSTPIPDVSNFVARPQQNYTIRVSPNTFTANGAIMITSTSLTSDHYTVRYHCKGTIDTAVSSNFVTTLTMVNGQGSIVVPPAGSSYATFYTIDSVINSDGIASAPVSPGNNVSLSDSTGLVITVINSEDSIRAYNVRAAYNAFALQMTAVLYTSITDYNVLYLYTRLDSGNSGTYNISGFDCYLTFTTRSAGTTTSHMSSYGTITLSSFSPFIFGNYNVTCTDSTKLNGSIFAIPQ